MKKHFLPKALLGAFLFVNLLSISALGQQPQPAEKMAELLIRLEDYIQWGAVPQSWVQGRKTWKANLQKDPSTVAKALVQFEQTLLPSAMEDPWGQRKVAWRKECLGAGQQFEKLGELLMEFEANMKWASLHDIWTTQRERWINDCNADIKAASQTNTPASSSARPMAPGNAMLASTDPNGIAFRD